MILLNDLSTHKEQKQILLDRIEKYKINKHCLEIKENEKGRLD